MLLLAMAVWVWGCVARVADRMQQYPKDKAATQGTRRCDVRFDVKQ